MAKMTDPHAALILAALTERPRSTGELAGLIHSSHRQVVRVVSDLIAAGQPIVHGVPGSHGGALYMLRTAPYCPPVRCAADGCGTILSRSNPGRFCRRHASAVDELIRWLEADVVQTRELFEATP